MSKFLVNFPCKPYVKRFLEVNYGNPDSLSSNCSIDISKDKFLYSEFRQKLKKKSFRRDSMYPTFTKYSESVNIVISKDDFYRYGWELSVTDSVYLNKILENRCKIFMYTIVGARVAIGMTLASSIDDFQEMFSFTEDIWQKESIYKDCQRNLNIERNMLSQQISQLIDKICMDKLSINRTTCRNLRRLYENNII